MKNKIKEYKVTITAKFPAAGERPGVCYYEAYSKADAIKQARRECYDGGMTRYDGPVKFKAEEIAQ